MLSLNHNIGYGSLAAFSLKINILLDRNETIKILNKNKIEIDKEALYFLNNCFHNRYWTDSGNQEFDYKGPGYVNIYSTSKV